MKECVELASSDSTKASAVAVVARAAGRGRRQIRSTDAEDGHAVADVDGQTAGHHPVIARSVGRYAREFCID